MTLADRERKTILDDDEMMAMFARKVRRIYGLSVDEYLCALREGTLPDKPEGAALEVLAGESARAQ